MKDHQHSRHPASEFRKEMQARYIVMLAIGGTIGTGLFLASGFTVNQAGPLDAVIAYALGALMVYCVMVCLGELKPQKVVLMGIAAGMRDKMALGEVILSERIVSYEGATALEGGKFSARPEMQKPGLSTQQDLNAYFATASPRGRAGSITVS